MKTVQLETKDIQGLVLKGYGSMRVANYLMLKVNDSIKAKKWLADILPYVSDGTHNASQVCLNIALTYHGLSALGMNENNLRNFGREFREGMVTPHRQRLLADFGNSDPTQWRWGGINETQCAEQHIHILLMVFGLSSEILNEYQSQLNEKLIQQGLEILMTLPGQLNDDNKEHFGFRDGIAQPIIDGTKQTGDPLNTVAPGEFLLGYKNQYGVYPETPLIAEPQGDLSILPYDQDSTSFKNIGHNGTYLVFRQMQQHVDRFWKFMNEQSIKEDGSIDEKESIKLASKMVGRWPSGSPLAIFPNEDPGKSTDMDDFGYAQLDKEGHRCPFGSHIRRTNPRDTFEDNKPKLSTKLTNKHRILRRGRSYGPQIKAGAGPHQYTTADEVGLLFICLNANIENQFEFVQRTWSNNPKFQNLNDDPDPITGTLENDDKTLMQNFTIQAEPVNRCVKDLPQFVTVRGGAYFFLPSMSALKYLSTI